MEAETRGRKPGIAARMKEAGTLKDQLWEASMGERGLEKEVSRLIVLRLGDYIKNHPTLPLLELVHEDPEEKSTEGMAAGSLVKILSDLAEAIERRDGSFLRRLADAVDAPDSMRQPSPDKVRVFLITNFLPLPVRYGEGVCPPRLCSDSITMRELLGMIDEKVGENRPRIVLKRLCKELGIKLKKDKLGRHR